MVAMLRCRGEPRMFPFARGYTYPMDSLWGSQKRRLAVGVVGPGCLWSSYLIGLRANDLLRSVFLQVLYCRTQFWFLLLVQRLAMDTRLYSLALGIFLRLWASQKRRLAVSVVGPGCLWSSYLIGLRANDLLRSVFLQVLYCRTQFWFLLLVQRLAMDTRLYSLALGIFLRIPPARFSDAPTSRASMYSTLTKFMNLRRNVGDMGDLNGAPTQAEINAQLLANHAELQATLATVTEQLAQITGRNRANAPRPRRRNQPIPEEQQSQSSEDNSDTDHTEPDEPRHKRAGRDMGDLDGAPTQAEINAQLLANHAELQATLATVTEQLAQITGRNRANSPQPRRRNQPIPEEQQSQSSEDNSDTDRTEPDEPRYERAGRGNRREYREETELMLHSQGGETNPFQKSNSPNPVRTTRTLTEPDRPSSFPSRPSSRSIAVQLKAPTPSVENMGDLDGAPTQAEINVQLMANHAELQAALATVTEQLAQIAGRDRANVPRPRRRNQPIPEEQQSQSSEDNSDTDQTPSNYVVAIHLVSGYHKKCSIFLEPSHSTHGYVNQRYLVEQPVWALRSLCFRSKLYPDLTK
ncbi:hypothetical protein DY000_02033244 [Brassica cretica]|uniref:Uncharacterized protein n=1 Tax=Brassica cretica TaxID=69181 RepID=A0ABQ7DNK4_BRACR|nr:hypothetical protein DY000_02033244 [Brassica cretica]